MFDSHVIIIEIKLHYSIFFPGLSIIEIIYMYVMLGYWMTNKDHVIDAKSLDWSDQMNNNLALIILAKQ